MCVLVTQLCPTLCGCIDCSPLGSSVDGISRQEYWSGLPLPSPGDLPDLEIKPGSPALQSNSLPSEPPGKPQYLTKYFCFIMSYRTFKIFDLEVVSPSSEMKESRGY